jgi:hypothetical protein|eukprot:COSAG06_NODE_6958_length_2699_cov_1.795000_5_plen_37_part_00
MSTNARSAGRESESGESVLGDPTAPTGKRPTRNARA